MRRFIGKSTRDIVVWSPNAYERLVSSNLDTGEAVISPVPIIAGHPSRRTSSVQRLAGVRALNARQPSLGLVCHREAPASHVRGRRPANEIQVPQPSGRSVKRASKRQQRSNPEGFPLSPRAHDPSVLHHGRSRPAATWKRCTSSTKRIVSSPLLLAPARALSGRRVAMMGTDNSTSSTRRPQR